MTEKSQCATQTYAMEHSRPSRGPAKTSPNFGNHIGKRDSDADGDDELALLGGYTRVIKASNNSASPGSTTGLAQSRSSPGGVSPGTTDPSSLPEPGLIFTDQPPRWDMSHSATIDYQHRARSDDQASSPSGDTTDLHVSSGGSASSGMSPVPSVMIPMQEPYMHHDPPLKPFEAPQGDTEMQYSGIPGYEYANSVSEQNLGIAGYEGDVIRIGRHPGPYHRSGHNAPGLQQHVAYAPMDVSTVPESQDWNFLDDWYGHVFQLDVIPPDYGQTTT